LKGGVPEGRGGIYTQASRNSEKNLSNLPHLKTFRRELRNNLTPAEARFWKVVQNKNLEGRKFRRQHSVGNYILDFYCPSEKLVIELDGEVHFGDKARVYDRERRLFLEHFGIKVLRSVDTPPQTGGELRQENTGGEFVGSEQTDLSKQKISDLNSPHSKGGVANASFDGVVALKTNIPNYTQTFAPIDILDYIYAVLHSPTYREKYKEFLKIDFPRVPFPKDAETFWQLVKLGGELRQIHLLESPKVEEFITTYPKDGDNIVTRKMTTRSIGFELTDSENDTGRVWINDEQYFDKVPNTAWEFYIGGYQPAQKWLKDRTGRELRFEDIRHYQKIIVALTETDRLMKEIDKIELE
jgi:very-short-patch-repair endonuclease